MKFTYPPESTPLDGYVIKRAIQKGGFGEVYYALSDAGKEVALKLLQNNLEIELRGVGQCLNLKHPHLVTIFDIKTDREGDRWIIMEYVNGQTLLDVLDAHPQGLPLEQTLHWLDAIASGLDFLHDRGIVHRDLKPANIYEETGTIKIGDVGLSKFITESRRGEQTQSVGTVYYMAPEVSRGQYGRELDVYSLGVMLYEMLTGRLPFDGDTAGEVLMKHLAEPPDLTRLAPAFRPVLARALEKDPARRTSTAGQLVREFRAAMRGESPWPAAPALDPRDQRRGGTDRAGRNLPPILPAYPVNGSPPLPPTPVATKSAADESTPFRDWVHENWKLLFFGGLIFAALFPGVMLRMMSPVLTLTVYGGLMALIAVIMYRVYAYIREEEDRRRELREAARQNPKPTSPNDLRQPVPAAPPPAAKSGGRMLTPDTVRAIPWRVRMSELFSSLSLAAFFTATLSGCLYVTGLFPDWETAAAFGLCTLVPAWTILAEAKLLEGRKVDATSRRLRMLLLGGLCGTLVYHVRTLLHPVFLMNLDDSPDAALTHISSQPLFEGSGPTLLGFALFFAMLFAARHWWRHVDSYRFGRVRLSSLLGTMLLAFLIPLVIAFPTEWAALWGVGLSAIVQLSAVWTPLEDRRA